jgi:putative flippase GtrA
MPYRSFGYYMSNTVISLLALAFFVYVMLAYEPDTSTVIVVGLCGALFLLMFVCSAVLAFRTRPRHSDVANDNFSLTVCVVGQISFWVLLIIQSQNHGALRVVLLASAIVCFIASAVGFSMHRWVYGPSANTDHPLGKIRLGEPRQDFNGSGLATGALTASRSAKGSITKQ